MRARDDGADGDNETIARRIDIPLSAASTRPRITAVPGGAGCAAGVSR